MKNNMKNSRAEYIRQCHERNDTLTKLSKMTRKIYKGKDKVVNDKLYEEYIEEFSQLYPVHIKEYFLSLTYKKKLLFLKQNHSMSFCFLYEPIDNCSRDAINDIILCRTLKYINCTYHNRKRDRRRARYYIEYPCDKEFRMTLCDECAGDLVKLIEDYRSMEDDCLSSGAFSIEKSKGYCHFCGENEDVFHLRFDKIRVRLCKACVDRLFDIIYKYLSRNMKMVNKRKEKIAAANQK